jgi:putative redox protein
LTAVGCGSFEGPTAFALPCRWSLIAAAADNRFTTEDNMPRATVTWVNGKQFVGTDSGGQSVVLSGSEDQGGVSPSEMLMVALAACTAYDVVAIMEKKRKPLTSLTVVVDGERDDDPPWPYRRLHLTYRVSGDDLSEKAVSQAIQLSEEKYCSVAATVRGVAEITTAFEIVAS